MTFYTQWSSPLVGVYTLPPGQHFTTKIPNMCTLAMLGDDCINMVETVPTIPELMRDSWLNFFVSLPTCLSIRATCSKLLFSIHRKHLDMQDIGNVHTRTHTRTHARTHTRTHAHTHTHTHTQTYQTVVERCPRIDS